MQPPEQRKGIKVTRPEPEEGLSINWKDGLPDDPLERAQIEQILITSGLTSKYSAIKRLLDGDDEAAEEELKRIEEEQAKQMLGEVAMMGASEGAPGAVPSSNPASDELTASAAALAKMRAERGQGDDQGGKQNPTKQKPSKK